MKWGIMPLSLHLALLSTVQRVSMHPRRVLSKMLCAACQRLIYWDEIRTKLQLGRLANWGSFFLEAPARVPSLGGMLAWMGECFDHVWQV